MEFKDISNEFHPQDIADNKIISALSYLGILFFLPLVVCPKSRVGKFCANQSLALFIAEIAIVIVRWVLRLIPILGGICSFILSIVSFILGILALVLLITTLMGKLIKVPIIESVKLIK